MKPDRFAAITGLLEAACEGRAAPLEQYLQANSTLPGPRMNLELLEAFARAVGRVVSQPAPPVEALEALLDGWADLSSDAAPVNDPREILPAAALRTYGRVATVRPDWWNDEVAKLRAGASSPRWRSREGVAMALQDMLEADWERARSDLTQWLNGDSPWEVRAAVAAIAEPRLLKSASRQGDALALQAQALAWYAGLPPGKRRLEPAKGLRKALGYTVSVVVAAAPVEGRKLMEWLAGSSDPDLQWVLRENLKKSRLKTHLGLPGISPFSLAIVMLWALLFPWSVLYAGTSADAAPLVIGDTFTIDSKALGETRRINVYLPPGYKEAPDSRVPVLYMPDGGMAEDFLHVAGLVQVSVGNGTMRPFLLVGIENTQRRRDMTGPTESEEDKKIAPKVGGSSIFRKFIRDELMPKIRAGYRTTGETAIVGESLAGLFVVETFFLEPDLFDTYIALDPSLWWNKEKLVKGASEQLRARPKLEKTLYLASSDEAGIATVTQRLAEILTTNAPSTLRWHYERMPDEKHSTIYHPAALKAFRSVFKPPIGAGP